MITETDYYILHFARIIYEAFPVIMLISGVGIILSSVHTEPWGTSVYYLGVCFGIAFIVGGIALMVK